MTHGAIEKCNRGVYCEGGKMLANFKIEQRLLEKFGEKARRHGGNRSKILRTMIRYFVGEKEGCEWLFVDKNE